mmetsp:Transcript_23331/g.61248  ORF Transcript_23331/g.61248 Transcript_23331/m.61248 type:complete len:124 (-) Transcript_23331:8-379(-)
MPPMLHQITCGTDFLRQHSAHCGLRPLFCLIVSAARRRSKNRSSGIAVLSSMKRWGPIVTDDCEDFLFDDIFLGQDSVGSKDPSDASDCNEEHALRGNRGKAGNTASQRMMHEIGGQQRWTKV